MIFITLGSQKFQFNRLLKEIDKLIEVGKIKEPVFAQIGNSNYKPIYYSYERFLDRDEFISKLSECNFVITHGGTGAIVGALKENRNVIAVPRLMKYGEHVDNHQLEIVNQFYDMNLILKSVEINELLENINKIENYEFVKYKSNTSEILENIDKFINS